MIWCSPWFFFDNSFRELSFRITGSSPLIDSLFGMGSSIGFHLTTNLENYPFGLLAVLHSLNLRVVGCETWFSFNSLFGELSLRIVSCLHEWFLSVECHGSCLFIG